MSAKDVPIPVERIEKAIFVILSESEFLDFECFLPFNRLVVFPSTF